jgi:superfamily II DNA or RNA helicase
MTAKDIFQKSIYNIVGNNNLREPQVEGYLAVANFFKKNNGHAILQIPVGCGKTGLMSILPFGVANGRVLIIAPNLEICKNIADELDINSVKCFWKKTGFLKDYKNGPFVAVLNDKANIPDCEDSHFIITNIQQLASSADKWLPNFSDDYFDLILVDEGHHNVAPSWTKVFEKFKNAKIVSLTATPVRSDGQKVEGETIYRYPFSKAMMKGYIKDITSVNVAPKEIRFTYKGDEKTHSLEDVLKLRDKDWFSRGVALSKESNISIVDASIQWLNYLRSTGTHHQIIAVACSIDHAREIRSLYEERGIAAKEIHGNMKEEEREEIKRDLRNFKLDCIVQVQLLGEGFDHRYLSVAAIFRPFRSLSPYIQFIGRIMRVIQQNAPGHLDNRGYIISHVGLNIDKHWDDFKLFDKNDQSVVKKWLQSGNIKIPIYDEVADKKRRKLSPDMVVLEEIIDKFITQDFIDPSDEAAIDNLVAIIQKSGFTLESLGLTREDLKQRMIRERKKIELEPETISTSPQKRRMQGRKRLNEQERSLANRILQALKLAPNTPQLVRIFPQLSAANNFGVAVQLVAQKVDELLNTTAGQREKLSLKQIDQARADLDRIGDEVQDLIKSKLKK